MSNISIFSVLLVIIIPKIRCKGCKRQFENKLGYSNHKRQCNDNIDTNIARCLHQLGNRQHDLNQIQFNRGEEGLYEGQEGVVDTAEGVDDDINMDDLVHLILDLLLIQVLSHRVNMIRMKLLTPPPPNCAHLADPIDKFIFQCAIGMNFHCSLPLSPIKSISITLTILVLMVILLLEICL